MAVGCWCGCATTEQIASVSIGFLLNIATRLPIRQEPRHCWRRIARWRPGVAWPRLPPARVKRRRPSWRAMRDRRNRMRNGIAREVRLSQFARAARDVARRRDAGLHRAAAGDTGRASTVFGRLGPRDQAGWLSLAGSRPRRQGAAADAQRPGLDSEIPGSRRRRPPPAGLHHRW